MLSRKMVQRAIANLVRDRTTIVSRIVFLPCGSADNIVVMEAGRIIEQGTHKGLLARGGQYQKLYEMQFADEEEKSCQLSVGT